MNNDLMIVKKVLMYFEEEWTSSTKQEEGSKTGFDADAQNFNGPSSSLYFPSVFGRKEICERSSLSLLALLLLLVLCLFPVRFLPVFESVCHERCIKSLVLCATQRERESNSIKLKVNQEMGWRWQCWSGSRGSTVRDGKRQPGNQMQGREVNQKNRWKHRHILSPLLYITRRAKTVSASDSSCECRFLSFSLCFSLLCFSVSSFLSISLQALIPANFFDFESDSTSH